MFKSIENKLVVYLLLLIVAVSVATYLIVKEQYVYLMLALMVVFFAINQLYRHYNRFNQNILFLLNALENGDYSFHFREGKISKRESELNRMMNRIKDILTHAKQDIIENERFLSLIIESVSTGIIIIDHNHQIRSANQATNQLLGMPVFTHLNQLAAIDEDFPVLFRDLQVGETKQIQLINEREEMQISLSASALKLKRGPLKIVTLSNIGNELEAKEIESWTRLIRVMTHEIMNSIAPITSLTDTLLFSYKYSQEDDSQVLKDNTIEALETISTTAKGLISFVDSYRQFTGVPQPVLAEFKLLPLLEKIINLESTHLINKNIQVSIHCDAHIILNADESQITQILINLIKNGIESMSTNTCGQLEIAVVVEDSRTHVRICNNGDPIPEEVLPHIFVPFFTTKETGTGIGLSVSRYIMRLHGGNLKHYTDEGWTVFSMVF